MEGAGDAAGLWGSSAAAEGRPRDGIGADGTARATCARGGSALRTQSHTAVVREGHGVDEGGGGAVVGGGAVPLGRGVGEEAVERSPPWGRLGGVSLGREGGVREEAHVLSLLGVGCEHGLREEGEAVLTRHVPDVGFACVAVLGIAVLGAPGARPASALLLRLGF